MEPLLFVDLVRLFLATLRKTPPSENYVPLAGGCAVR
jgi:hypothetical protein